MRKFGGFIVAAACGISLMGYTCGGDDSSNPLDAGNGIDSSTTNGDAANGGDTSTSPNDGGSDAAAAGTVNGIVFTEAAFPGIEVIVNGVAVTTDANGKFSVPNVPASYTMTVIYPGAEGSQIFTWVGATTRTPILQGSGYGPHPHTDSTQVSASLAFTPPAGEILNAQLVSPHSLGDPGVPTPSNLFPNPVTWSTSTDILSVDVWAFLFDSTNATIEGFYEDPAFPLSPTDGGTAAVTTPISFGALGTIQGLVGSASAPPGYTLSLGSPCVMTQGNDFGNLRIGSYSNTTATSTDFACNFPTPLITAGWKPFVFMLAVGAADGSSCQKELAVTSSMTTAPGVTFELPAIMTAPLNAATSVDLTKPITWTLPANPTVPLNQLSVTFDNGNAFTVFSAGVGSVTLPDLSAYGVTFGDSGDDGQAQISDYDGIDVDTMLSATPYSGPYAAGASRTNSFTIK